jgi:hypothetical protein
MSPPDEYMSDVLDGDGGNNQHDIHCVHGETVSDVESPLEIFQSITMIEVLEQDPRPAFVLDLDNSNLGGRIHPVFLNRAFRNARLIDVITGIVPPDTYGQSSHLTYSAFSKWTLTSTAQREPSFLYHGMTWTSMDINRRWRMVNGIKERQQERMTGAFATASWGPKAISVVPSA